MSGRYAGNSAGISHSLERGSESTSRPPYLSHFCALYICNPQGLTLRFSFFLDHASSSISRKPKKIKQLVFRAQCNLRAGPRPKRSPHRLQSLRPKTTQHHKHRRPKMFKWKNPKIPYRQRLPQVHRLGPSRIWYVPTPYPQSCLRSLLLPTT
jgi:hypothetical protein